jgi:hypothetical protein
VNSVRISVVSVVVGAVAVALICPASAEVAKMRLSTVNQGIAETSTSSLKNVAGLNIGRGLERRGITRYKSIEPSELLAGGTKVSLPENPRVPTLKKCVCRPA